MYDSCFAEITSTRRAFDRFRTTFLDQNSMEHQEFIASVMSKPQPAEAKQAKIHAFLTALEAWKPKVSNLLANRFQPDLAKY